MMQDKSPRYPRGTRDLPKILQKSLDKREKGCYTQSMTREICNFKAMRSVFAMQIR